jgi:uncharacterized membrane protein YkgB
MDALFALSQRVAAPFLRLSLGLVVLWVGALKFGDPDPVVGLLDASLPFLASNAVVYLLGVVEVVTALLILGNFAIRYVGLVLVGLFAGTLLTFLVAPAVTYGDAGFPRLTLTGEFALKDLVLFAAAITLVATDSARAPASSPAVAVRMAQPQPR